MSAFEQKPDRENPRADAPGSVSNSEQAPKGDSASGQSGKFEIELDLEQPGDSAREKERERPPAPVSALAEDRKAPIAEFRASTLRPPVRPQKSRRARPRRGFAGFMLTLLRALLITLLLSALIGYIGYKSLERVIGGREVVLPNLAGLELQTALKQLQAAGLTLELEGEEYHDYLMPGKIIRQYPRPGMNVKTRSPVRVTVSLGSAKRLTPNLVGLNAIDAKIQLRANRLAVGPLAFIHSGDAKDVVIAQDPPAGTRAAEDSPVRMLVSLGPRRPEYEMPRLIGLNAQQARELLARYRLNWERVEIRGADQSPPAEEFRVLEQQPAAGQPLPPEEEIVLSFGKE